MEREIYEAELEKAISAIHNGRFFLEVIASRYAFECEGCSLENCQDFINLCQSFEKLADFVEGLT